MSVPFRLLSCTLLMFAAACADAPRPPDHYVGLQKDLDVFKAAQMTFRDHDQQAQWSFPGQGEVLVRDVALEGYPGNDYVRCKFHYRNTTGKNVRCAWVSLDVLDARGTMVASQVSLMIVPTAIPIVSGEVFADELRTRTHGVYLQPGWSWRLTCKCEFEDQEPMLRPGQPRNLNSH